MSTTQQGSSGVGASSRRSDRSARRAWTKFEEITLISVMKEIISQGWKADNGFRPGYLHRVEAMMQKEIQGCELKATPHINSRLASWKKMYNSLNNALSRSGVGFNSHGNHMLDVEDEQWEQILKMDPTMRGKRFTQWPYYDAWKDIFGRDRANGECAKDVYEAYTALDSQGGPETGEPHDSDGFGTNFPTENESERNSQSRSDFGETQRGSVGKKRKAHVDVDPLCQLLADLHHSTNIRLDKIAERIGVEYDKGEARKELLKQLGQIQGLSVADKFNLCELIAFKAERLDLWRGMSFDERAQYVDHLLSQSETRGKVTAGEWP